MRILITILLIALYILTGMKIFGQMQEEYFLFNMEGKIIGEEKPAKRQPYIYAVNRPREELPELNQKILHYTDSVEGKHIGKGLCRHFVNEAISYATGERFKKKWFAISDLASVFAWEGYNLPREYALPGDIVSFTLHVGVIYKLYDNDCCIVIAHQNSPKGNPVKIEDYCLRESPVVKYIRVMPLVRKRYTLPCNRKANQ